MPNSELQGAASGAASGASIGNVVPGIGTAVGAVVGAAVGFVSSLVGGGTHFGGDDVARQYVAWKNNGNADVGAINAMLAIVKGKNSGEYAKFEKAYNYAKDHNMPLGDAIAGFFSDTAVGQTIGAVAKNIGTQAIGQLANSASGYIGSVITGVAPQTFSGANQGTNMYVQPNAYANVPSYSSVPTVSGQQTGWASVSGDIGILPIIVITAMFILAKRFKLF